MSTLRKAERPVERVIFKKSGPQLDRFIERVTRHPGGGNRPFIPTTALADWMQCGVGCVQTRAWLYGGAKGRVRWQSATGSSTAAVGQRQAAAGQLLVK